MMRWAAWYGRNGLWSGWEEEEGSALRLRDVEVLGG